MGTLNYNFCAGSQRYPYKAQKMLLSVQDQIN